MSKIGIFTFHTARNVGAKLQAYALKTVLQGMTSLPVEFVPYSSVEWMDKLIRFENLKLLIQSVLALPITLLANRSHSRFKNLYLSQEPLCLKESLPNVCADYVKIIVGSDQVWNYNLTKRDPSYLLDFLNDDEKKSSYAASFGFDNVFQDNADQILPFLSKFSHLSTREAIGHDLMRKHGLSPLCHLDPTLLLGKSDYQMIMVKQLIKDKYVFIYEVYPSKRIDKLARKYAKQRGLKVVRLCPSLAMTKILKGGKSYICSAPNVFLSLLFYAERVFTTSFHGVAFSLIFNKLFLTEVNGTNHRIEHLLNLVGLRNRVIDDIKGYEGLYNLADIPVDWDAVQGCIDEQKVKSFLYLNEILSDIGE